MDPHLALEDPGLPPRIREPKGLVSSKCGLGLRDRGSPLGTAWIELSPAQAELSCSQERPGVYKDRGSSPRLLLLHQFVFHFQSFPQSIVNTFADGSLSPSCYSSFLVSFFSTFLYKTFATAPTHTFVIITRGRCVILLLCSPAWRARP